MPTPSPQSSRPYFIGLMSGTSLDGVDAALLTTDGDTIACFGAWLTVPYEPAFRRRLRGVLGGRGDIAPVERELTLIHAGVVRRLLAEDRLDLALVTCLPGAESGEIVRREPTVWACSARHLAHEVDPLPLALSRPIELALARALSPSAARRSDSSAQARRMPPGSSRSANR